MTITALRKELRAARLAGERALLALSVARGHLSPPPPIQDSDRYPTLRDAWRAYMEAVARERIAQARLDAALRVKAEAPPRACNRVRREMKRKRGKVA